MRTILGVSAEGVFTVDDDPHGVIAAALRFYLHPTLSLGWETDLAPNGSGLEIENGWIITRIDNTAHERWRLHAPEGTEIELEGDELRRLMLDGFCIVLRRELFPVRHVVSMRESGGVFTVSHDADGVVAGALHVCLASPQAEQWKTALLPDGEGLSVPGYGSVGRAFDQEYLPLLFAYLPEGNPAATELWWIHLETPSRSGALTGAELRKLVAQGAALRDARRSP